MHEYKPRRSHGRFDKAGKWVPVAAAVYHTTHIGYRSSWCVEAVSNRLDIDVAREVHPGIVSY